MGPVRTGVTAILPRGKQSANTPVFRGWFSLNGNGEMTGTTWIEESGFLEGPVMITNTHSVGVVRDSVVAWRVKQGSADATGYWWSLPVVAETYDGYLNDINGFHVKEKHAFEALDAARPGAVTEGNVGGGTGMICYGFKGGIGTASRKLDEKSGGHTVGVLVQANFGRRNQLRMMGSLRLRDQDDNFPLISLARGMKTWLDHHRRVRQTPAACAQLKRLASAAPALWVARTGSIQARAETFYCVSTKPRAASKPLR